MKNIIICLISLLIVVTTGGMNIFIYNCSCCPDESISVISEANQSCGLTENSSACCTEPMESHDNCDTGVDMEVPLSDSEDNCCKIIQKYIKIEDDYLLSFSKVNFKIFRTINLLLTSDNVETEVLENRNISDYLISLPSLLYGKSLVFYLNQLKIDVPAIARF